MIADCHNIGATQKGNFDWLGKVLMLIQGPICVSLIRIKRFSSNNEMRRVLFYSVLDHFPQQNHLWLTVAVWPLTHVQLIAICTQTFIAQYLEVWLPKKAVYKRHVCVKMRDFRFFNYLFSSVTAVQEKTISKHVIKYVTIIFRGAIWKTLNYALSM